MKKISLFAVAVALSLFGASVFAQADKAPAKSAPAPSAAPAAQPAAKSAAPAPSSAPAAEAPKPAAETPKPATEAPASAAAPKKPAGPPPNAVVEAVQMPAWVERQGEGRLPLMPGMALKAHDKLYTGANSRLLLKTADGSAVKLGENGSMSIDAMQMRKDKVFQAALQVVAGAFRFTTEALAKFRGKREVNVAFATVTAGIRGTDLWGKSAPNRQVVCLIEGRIEVTPPGEAAIVMDQPLSFFVRENGASKPVAPVPAEQLKQWALETDTQAGQGVAKRGGKWTITVSSKTAGPALNVYKDIRAAGYAAELHPTKVADKRSYIVRVANFASKADAEAVASSLKQQGRFGDASFRISGGK
jgi:hypothetical protein